MVTLQPSLASILLQRSARIVSFAGEGAGALKWARCGAPEAYLQEYIIQSADDFRGVFDKAIRERFGSTVGGCRVTSPRSGN